MKLHVAIAPVAAIALAAVLIAGCAGKPTLYYTLADSALPTATPASAGAAPVYIDMAPVAMPERLARPQMVVRQQGDASAQVDVLEQHRWASSFENELRDALASGVATRLGGIDITKGGRQATTPAYRIAVQVRQFEATEGSRIDGNFSWTLRRTDETRVTACQLSISEPVGTGMDAVAQGARRLTGKLAAAIARSVSIPADVCRNSD
jgi:uncharacterized lipoprotein YmbA